jgi:hypothetical protein
MSENAGTTEPTEPVEPTTTLDQYGHVTEPTEPVAGEEALGDAGKKALDRMKAERNAAREAAQTAKEELEKAREQLAAAQSREDVDRILAEREAAIAAEYQRKLAQAEIRAASIGKVVDVDLVLSLPEFDPTNFVTDSGDVDEDRIATAINDLVSSKPYLAAQGQGVKGSGDGGTRNGSQPSQLTRTDLARMSPEEIRKAQDEGRLNALLSGA